MPESGFTIQQEGQEGLVGIFEDDGETGTLYLFDSTLDDGDQGILVWIPVYVRSEAFQPSQSDVWVTWSIDFSKVAATVKGQNQSPQDCFRPILDARSRQAANRFMREASAEPLRESEWLRGFEWTWTSDGASDQ
jgi:hypothetical protein